MIYNCEITSVEDYKQLKDRFPNQQHWMIGRGAISNRFLYEMIQENDVNFPLNWQNVFHDFIVDLAENNLEHSSNQGNVL